MMTEFHAEPRFLNMATSQGTTFTKSTNANAHMCALTPIFS